MKKSTAKLFLWIGIGWALLMMKVSNNLASAPTNLYYSPSEFYNLWLYTFAIFGIPAWVLIIIAITKWNSEKEHADIKKAQLQALRRGKVNVELKSRMRKLK